MTWPCGKTIGLSATLLVVAAAQIWTVIFRAPWPAATSTISYTQLADAFLHGHVNLLQQPDPRLLELPDPYDARAGLRYALQDASLFDGKYYLYWGPVPALLTAGVCLICGISHPTFGDQYLLLFFRLGIVACAATLIFQAKDRLGPRQPLDAALVAILSLGLGAPILFTPLACEIYNAEIAGGQFFLLAGLCAAWFSLLQNRTGLMMLAGCLWTLSCGSRTSLMPAISIIVLFTLVHIHRKPRQIAGLMIPLAAGAITYGWYNIARFHSFTDFGWRYQLSELNQHSARLSDFFSIGHIPANLLSYIAAAPVVMRSFPFVRAVNPVWVDFLWSHLRHRFNTEPLIGLAIAQPFLIFAVNSFSELRRGDAITRWLTVSLLAAVILGATPDLAIRYTSMRYIFDAVPCLTILAAIGYFRLLAKIDHRPKLRRESRSLVRFFVLAQCVLGLLLSFQV